MSPVNGLAAYAIAKRLRGGNAPWVKHVVAKTDTSFLVVKVALFGQHGYRLVSTPGENGVQIERHGRRSDC